MRTFVRWLLRHRVLAAAAIFVTLGFASWSSRTLVIRFQFRDFFDYPRNAQLPLFKKDAEELGDPAGHVVALLEASDVFAPSVLGYVDELTRAIEPDPLFVRVRSLTNARAIRAQGGTADDGEVASGPLLPRLPATPEQIAAARSHALASPLYLRRLVSADAKSTAVLAEMRTPATFASIDEQGKALAAVRDAVAKHPPPAGVALRVTGAPVVEVETTRSLMKDQLVLMPGVMSLIILALWLTFRSARGVLVPLTAVNVAMTWTTGIFATFGRPVDIIGSVIPTALLVYGVVDPIFVLTRFLSKVDEGLSREDAIVESQAELALPCALTSVTTALGFGAFITAAAPTIRFYGLTVAIGVLLAWVTTVTVLPLLLSVMPLPKRRAAGLGTPRRVDAALVRIARFVAPRPGLVALAAAAAVLLGGFAARHQHIVNEYVGGLPRGTTQADVRHFEDRLSGVIRLVLHLEGDEGSMKRPEVLQAMAKIDAAMEMEPLVTSSTSLARLVGEANQAFEGGDVAKRVVPSSRALVAQYLQLIDPADRRDLVTDDYARGHVAVLVVDRGSEQSRALATRLEHAAADAGFAKLGVRAEVTGNGVVAYRELDNVVVELLWGFVLAFGIILALEWLVFRSLRLALLTLLPNLLPVVACFLVIRFTGMNLKIDNALVLCVSIGGLFNTTIHLVARVRLEVAQGERDRDAAVLAAVRAAGPPSLYTAAILSAGFAVLGASSFPGLQALGLLSMVTLLTGFLSDVVVTPALLRLGFPWKDDGREETAPLSLEEVPS